ncbi:MAG TPA: DedA family protein [Stellaceae bacterium]|nr:DedA family protein [Stellaceae bacterium]
MLESIIAAVATVIVATISAIGYAGIVLLMAIESACIPLPSEIIMPFSGYLVFTGRFDLVLVATAGAIGCNLGSTVAYAIGYYGGRPLVEKWGAYVLLSRRDLAMVDSFFDRFGSITVFVSRLLPVARTFIALPAGIARMSQIKFQVYTFLGSWPWCFALAYIGAKLGERWESDPTLRDVLHRFDALIVAVLVLGIVWYVWRHWKHRLSSDK